MWFKIQACSEPLFNTASREGLKKGEEGKKKEGAKFSTQYLTNQIKVIKD